MVAKSTVTMFIVMNLTLTGRKKNVILTSNSKDNAVRLLDPYRANLEANGRIMAYYGKQELPGSWTEDEFTTKGKVSFRALASRTISAWFAKRGHTSRRTAGR